MFVPELCSEREPGQWEDCVWCSGVMLANGIAGANVRPSTRDEYEGLRFDATGVAEAGGDGSNLRELRTGLERRYHLTDVQLGGGWPGFLQACPPGRYAVVQGMNGSLPTRLRGTNYLGPHAIAFARDRDLSGILLQPLDPPGAGGERATLGELRAFYETLPGAEWLVGPIIGRRAADLRFKTLRNVAGKVTVAQGSGYQFVTLDGRRIDAPAGQVREAIALVELTPPLDDAPGDRATAYLVGRCLWPVIEPANIESMILLASAAVPNVVNLEVPT